MCNCPPGFIGTNCSLRKFEIECVIVVSICSHIFPFIGSGGQGLKVKEEDGMKGGENVRSFQIVVLFIVTLFVGTAVGEILWISVDTNFIYIYIMGC